MTASIDSVGTQDLGPRSSEAQTRKKPGPTNDAEVGKRLRKYFRRSGYIRRPDLKRRKTEGQGYKKGHEVRLVLKDGAEMREVRSLLRRAGLRPAAPFAKGSRIVQPVYSQAAVAFFLKWERRDRRLYEAGGRARRRSWSKRG